MKGNKYPLLFNPLVGGITEHGLRRIARESMSSSLVITFRRMYKIISDLFAETGLSGSPRAGAPPQLLDLLFMLFCVTLPSSGEPVMHLSRFFFRTRAREPPFLLLEMNISLQSQGSKKTNTRKES